MSSNSTRALSRPAMPIQFAGASVALLGLMAGVAITDLPFESAASAIH
jgi:hypothetical protein